MVVDYQEREIKESIVNKKAFCVKFLAILLITIMILGSILWVTFYMDADINRKYVGDRKYTLESVLG